MAYFRRLKAALDGFRNPSSKRVPRSPIQESCSRIFSNGSVSSVKFSSGLFSYSCISQRVRRNSCYNLNFNIAKRYYAGRNNVQYCGPRGPIDLVIMFFPVFLAVNLEFVPFTERSHFVFMPKYLEKLLGELQFEQLKDANKEKILPGGHPDSMRVRLILKDIIEVSQRGLKHEKVLSDLGYAPTDVADEGSTVLSGNGEGRKIEGKWHHEDEILDDKWVKKSRKEGQKKWLQPATSYLDGWNLEVLVVNDPVASSFSLHGGKIVVSTTLLENFGTDIELATVIGHEVAHAVARHLGERLTMLPWVVNKQAAKLKMEIEADYIGLLLVASAGYDPRLVPKVYEKFGQMGDDSEHYDSVPLSGKERAQLLAQAKVMDEALAIFREVKACGYVTWARKLFDELSNSDVVSWNSMIIGYSRSRDLDAADLFRIPNKRNIVSWKYPSVKLKEVLLTEVSSYNNHKLN